MKRFEEKLSFKENRVVYAQVYFPETDEEANSCLDDIEVSLSFLDAQDKALGFDTETTGLYPESTDCNLRLVQLGVKEAQGLYKSYSFDVWMLEDSTVERIVMLLESTASVKVGHNLKFDIKFVKKNLSLKRFGRLFCTDVASRLLAYGLIYDYKFNLKAVADRYLELDVDKDEQVSDWSKEVLSDSQIRYSGKDAIVPLLVREEMIPEIKREKLIKAAKLEFDTVEPVSKLEFDGFYLNQTKWKVQYENVKRKIQEIEIEVSRLLPSDQKDLFEDSRLFNLSSTKELAHRLALQGVSLPLTEKGNPSRKADALEQIIDEHESIPLLIEYAGLNKLLTSYGLNILEYVNKDTKRIHASFNQLGAPTSRFACFSPNLQQIPQEDEYRNCFEPEKGRILVGADYSQIELRILAEFSKDETFISGFTSGEDFHTWTASQVFDRPIEDVTKEQRNFAKRLNFGIVYGIGAPRLAAMLGIERDAAQAFMNRYFAKFPKVTSYLEYTAKRTVRFRRSYTAIGRYTKYNFDKDNRQERAMIERNGKNAPVQGTSADILKRALRVLYDAIDLDEVLTMENTKLVNIVHDEIILETDRALAKRVSKVLHSSMMQAGGEFLKLCPVKVDVETMKEWKK